jgi:hypothetical protein
MPIHDRVDGGLELVARQPLPAGGKLGDRCVDDRHRLGFGHQTGAPDDGFDHPHWYPASPEQGRYPGQTHP